MRTVFNEHNSIVKLLLDQPEMETNEKDRFGLMALHPAAGGNNPKVARRLFLHPAFNSTNSTDAKGLCSPDEGCECADLFDLS